MQNHELIIKTYESFIGNDTETRFVQLTQKAAVFFTLTAQSDSIDLRLIRVIKSLDR